VRKRANQRVFSGKISRLSSRHASGKSSGAEPAPSATVANTFDAGGRGGGFRGGGDGAQSRRGGGARTHSTVEAARVRLLQ
jgi:hypothetical protein